MSQRKIVLKVPPKRVPAMLVSRSCGMADERMQRSPVEDNHGCLCSILGALFGPFGILIAAVVAKAQGVKAAILGWLLICIPFAIIFTIIILFILPSGLLR